MKQGRESGFTLVELMLVVVILGILAAVVLPNLAGKIGIARKGGVKAQISAFENALDQFEIDCGRYPTTEEGLQALITDPGIEGWHGPYLRKKSALKDPWGKPYMYNVEATRSGINYDVYSTGEDGQDNTEDDIGNWEAEETS